MTSVSDECAHGKGASHEEHALSEQAERYEADAGTQGEPRDGPILVVHAVEDSGARALDIEGVVAVAMRQRRRRWLRIGRARFTLGTGASAYREEEQRTEEADNGPPKQVRHARRLLHETYPGGQPPGASAALAPSGTAGGHGVHAIAHSCSSRRNLRTARKSSRPNRPSQRVPVTRNAGLLSPSRDESVTRRLALGCEVSMKVATPSVSPFIAAVTSYSIQVPMDAAVTLTEPILVPAAGAVAHVIMVSFQSSDALA